MLQDILTAAQIVILVIVGVILGQVWKLLRRKDLPDDEPLSEQQVQWLHKKLRFLVVFVVAEAAVSIAQTILRFVDSL